MTECVYLSKIVVSYSYRIRICILDDPFGTPIIYIEITLNPSYNVQKENNYWSMHGLKHGTVTRTKKQDVRDPLITSVKQFKQNN